VTRLGGRLVCAYVTTGQYDVALVVEMPNGDDDTVGRRDNVVGECADDNRPGVHSRGIWQTRRRSAHDDITAAIKPCWGAASDSFSVRFRAPIFHHLSNRPDPAGRFLTSAEFQEARVERQTREGSFDSFHEYWEPIQAGIGSTRRTRLGEIRVWQAVAYEC